MAGQTRPGFAVRPGPFQIHRPWLLVLALAAGMLRAAALELTGVSVIPHVQSDVMRYRRPPDPGLGARVQLFLRNDGTETMTLSAAVPVRFRGQTPEELVRNNSWTWHDAPSAWPSNVLQLPPGSLTVWSFNSRSNDWGAGTRADLVVELPGRDAARLPVALDAPRAWLSAVTFLGTGEDVQPDSMIFHVANETEGPLRLVSTRLWLPADQATWRALRPGPVIELKDRFPADGRIPARDKGGARVATGRLPLTFAAVEVRVADGSGREQSLWAHLRIKREVFDISGGWVAEGLRGSNTLHSEIYLKTLHRMHVNAGMHDQVPGYTDNPGLFGRYPLKYMNRCQPFERFDTDAVLPRIHAVEFLGEPQFGGGRPVPPMEVWRALAPYQSTRLPTSVTHSEERIWRYYAGLSDYPHYDAYRVCAPAPDSWGQYDRWGGERLRWAAPLETIGDMTRSLRDLNRPMPVAYWSQGAHHDWGRYGGRQRTSPTPDELVLQAYHGLSSRITSLYWFNLSLKSLVKFRDLIGPITRVGREIRLLEPFLLEGDAFRHARIARADGRPDWELASVCGPRAGLLFALDVDYRPDPEGKVFRFGDPRPASWTFPLPAYLGAVTEVFRVDADGVRDVRWEKAGGGVRISDAASRVAVYVATADPGLRKALGERRLELLRREEALGFDPAGREEDFAALRRLLEGN